MSPRLTASKEAVQGPAPMPEGMYTVRFDGFDPKYAKDKQSVNLNPKLKVINHPEYNDRPIFDNWNTKAVWLWPDYHHAFGVPIAKDGGGDYEFVGFDGPEDDPTKWQYNGPLIGQQAQLYLVQADNTKGGVKNAIKYYVCKLAGCQEKHSSDLIK